MKTTEPVIVAGIFGNEGETEGSLSLCANVEPSPMYPDARIYVGSPKSSAVDHGMFCLSPDRALELAAKLVEVANAAVAACPQATIRVLNYPARVATRVDEENVRAFVGVAKAWQASRCSHFPGCDKYDGSHDACCEIRANEAALSFAVDAVEPASCPLCAIGNLCAEHLRAALEAVSRG